jgi:uncharacterized membrane protein
MTPKKFLFRFLAALLSTTLLDFIWLGNLMGGFYRTELGGIVLTNADGGFDPRVIPTLLVYVLIPLGIALFTRPAQASAGLHPKLIPSAIKGAVFGLVLYGTYDMTNWSLLKAWTPTLSLIDTAWGMALCSAGSVAASFAESHAHSHSASHSG